MDLAETLNFFFEAGRNDIGTVTGTLGFTYGIF
jgi:hypothetical protein